MTDIILTINAGSSSVKFSAFGIADGKLTPLASGQIDGIGAKATFLARQDGGEKTRVRARREPAAPVDHAWR